MARQLEHFPNLVSMFFARAGEKGDRPFLWARHSGQWQPISWNEAARQVAALAASLRKLGHSEPVDTMYQAAGCYSCADTGYHGRVGVFELLLIEGPIRDALQREVSIDEIRRMLPDTGFRSMQQDALDKVVQGQTTLDEVLHAFPLVV